MNLKIEEKNGRKLIKWHRRKLTIKFLIVQDENGFEKRKFVSP